MIYQDFLEAGFAHLNSGFDFRHPNATTSWEKRIVNEDGDVLFYLHIYCYPSTANLSPSYQAEVQFARAGIPFNISTFGTMSSTSLQNIIDTLTLLWKQGDFDPYS
jgi:hypothetical protein